MLVLLSEWITAKSPQKELKVAYYCSMEEVWVSWNQDAQLVTENIYRKLEHNMRKVIKKSEADALIDECHSFENSSINVGTETMNCFEGRTVTQRIRILSSNQYNIALLETNELVS